MTYTRISHTHAPNGSVTLYGTGNRSGSRKRWVTIHYAELFTLHSDREWTPLGFIQNFPLQFPLPFPVPCSVTKPLCPSSMPLPPRARFSSLCPMPPAIRDPDDVKNKTL